MSDLEAAAGPPGDPHSSGPSPSGSGTTVPEWLPGSSRVDPENEPIFAEVLRTVTGA